MPAPNPASDTPLGPAVVLDRIAAVVGDDIVLESEIERQVLVELEPRLPGEDDEKYRDRVLNIRIDELVREKKLRTTGGVDPDPREIEARLQELEKRLDRAGQEPLDARLIRAGATRDDVKGWIRRGLALSTYVRERISPTVKITENELKTFYEGPFRTEAAKNGISTLPPISEVRDQLAELIRERKLNEAIERWTAELRIDTRTVIYRRPAVSSGGPAGSAPSPEARR